MEEVETGTINSYEQPRSRRLKENISSSDESENDDAGMSGFYIREKTDKSKVKKDAEVSKKEENDVISHLNSNAEVNEKEQTEVTKCPDIVTSNEEKDEDKKEEESTVERKDEHETVVSERNILPNKIEDNIDDYLGRKEVSELIEEEQACESKASKDNFDKNCTEVKTVEEVDDIVERNNVQGDKGPAGDVVMKNCTTDDSVFDGETETHQRDPNEIENQNQSHCDVDNLSKTENGGSKLERENTNDKTVNKTNDSLSAEEVPSSNMPEKPTKEEDKSNKREEEDKLDKSETANKQNEEPTEKTENNTDKSATQGADKKNEELTEKTENHTDKSETQVADKQNEEPTEKTENNTDKSETQVADKQNEEPTDRTDNNTDKLGTETVNKHNGGSSDKTEDNSDKSGTEQNTEDDKNEDSADKLSFLKEQLLLPKNDDSSQTTCENNGSAEGEQEMDMEDFDPSLLCPDISMDVDDQPVIPPNETPTDGSSSPLPYEPAFSTYVDEMNATEVTFDLTPEECELRSRMYGKDNPIQYSKIHCSACNVHLGSALDGQKNRFVHPLLKVLICKNCYHFYTSGEFEKDEDGSELYCRWCGQGGQVLCCSDCEFVFCKRCIRNNFGLKKFKDIKSSDDWLCFRCDPSQIAPLRATCAELMDYIRTEMAKASAVINDSPDFMTKDYSLCCQKPEKKEPAAPKEPGKRKKRKVSNDDPDYNPLKDLEEAEQKRLAVAPVTIAPVPIQPNIGIRAPVPVVTAAPAQAIRVVAPGFRPTGLGYTVTRPAAAQGSVRSTGPGYIKIMPPKPAQTTPSFTPMRQPVRSNMSQPQRMPMFQQKHEWFEKTVRAAARVNSNLSYTLTQLNRQQATASSVEALAVVHNKLQEVLSTSINSLIQIRKNLRTEFIAGIKAIKVPSRPTPPLAAASTAHASQAKDDDDVIFVSNAPAPKPAATVPVPKSAAVSKPSGVSKVVTNNATNNVVRSLPPGISVVKRIAPKPTEIAPKPIKIAPKPTEIAPKLTETAPKPTESVPKPTQTAPDLYSNPTPSTSFSLPNATETNNSEKKGGYIKVKSFSALQSVPSECITIPDDPPPLILMKDSEPEERIESEVPPSLSPVKLVEETLPGKRKRSQSPDLSECREANEDTGKEGSKVQVIEKDSQLNGSKEDSNDLKAEDQNILNCKIVLRRSKEIDQLVKKTCDVVNGD